MSADLDTQMAEEAAGVKVGDVTFEPFTGRRVYAVNRIGLAFYTLTGEDRRRLAKAPSLLPYPGVDQDVAVLLYLCAHGPEESKRAHREPDELIWAAQDWALAQGFAYRGEHWQEALEAFFTLLLPIFHNDAKQVLSPEDTELARKSKKKDRVPA